MDNYSAFAACRGLEKADFFSHEEEWRPAHEKAAFKTKAIALCNLCSVKNDCLEYAIENRISHGIWGGQTASKRRRIIAARIKAGTLVTLHPGRPKSHHLQHEHEHEEVA